MKYSEIEKEIREMFELLEENNLFDKNLFELEEDELVIEIENIKYKYFKKGFLARMLMEE